MSLRNVAQKRERFNGLNCGLGPSFSSSRVFVRAEGANCEPEMSWNMTESGEKPESECQKRMSNEDMEEGEKK
jgi:hypothetical protein